MKRTLLTLALALLSTPVWAQDIQTVAGNGAFGKSGDGGQATAAAIGLPEHVATIPGGGYYITATAQIRKVAPNGIITTIAGDGTVGFSGDGGPALSARLASQVTSIFLARDGSLFFSEYGNNRIRKIATDGIISTVAGNGGTTPVDGVAATSSGLNGPTAVEFDDAGNMYIVEFNNCRLRKVNTSGIISTLAGGSCAQGAEGIPALNSGLYLPWGMRIGANGDIFIAEYSGNRVRRIDAAGTIATAPGTSGIEGPLDVDLDSAGNLYVSSFDGSLVHKVTPAGVRTAFAGTGVGGFAGDGGPAIAAQLLRPRGVTVGQGRLYIADGSNARVREVIADVTPIQPAGFTTCAAEGFTGTKLTLCRQVCEIPQSPARLSALIKVYVTAYREDPPCAN